MKKARPASSVYSVLDELRSEISRCVKCGSCRSACPSFLRGREESLSARGRMALVKALMDGRLEVSRIFKDKLATCTMCLACEASCASGVRVTDIVQAAKEQIVEQSGHGFLEILLAAVLKSNTALRSSAWLAPAVLHFSGASMKGGGQGIVSKSRVHRIQRDAVNAKKKNVRGKVVFFPGCAVKYFQPDVAAAVNTVLNAIGYDVIVPGALKCCGRPLLSLGDRRAAEALAARNSALFARLGADAVVTACASCGLTFKREYPKLLLSSGAKSPVVLDIHEFVASRIGDISLAPMKRMITVHDPCHLNRGQGLSEVVRNVLRAVPGLTLVDMKNADRCCGFGGVMRVTHHALSDGIAKEKAMSIVETGASAVATGCPGCRMQITDALRRSGSDIAVFHPAQILGEALGNAE